MWTSVHWLRNKNLILKFVSTRNTTAIQHEKNMISQKKLTLCSSVSSHYFHLPLNLSFWCWWTLEEWALQQHPWWAVEKWDRVKVSTLRNMSFIPGRSTSLTWTPWASLAWAQTASRVTTSVRSIGPAAPLLPAPLSCCHVATWWETAPSTSSSRVQTLHHANATVSFFCRTHVTKISHIKASCTDM